MTGDSDEVELRHKSGESLELQTSAASAQQSQSTSIAVRRKYRFERSPWRESHAEIIKDSFQEEFSISTASRFFPCDWMLMRSSSWLIKWNKFVNAWQDNSRRKMFSIQIIFVTDKKHKRGQWSAWERLMGKQTRFYTISCRSRNRSRKCVALSLFVLQKWWRRFPYTGKFNSSCRQIIVVMNSSLWTI